MPTIADLGWIILKVFGTICAIDAALILLLLLIHWRRTVVTRREERTKATIAYIEEYVNSGRAKREALRKAKEDQFWVDYTEVYDDFK